MPNPPVHYLQGKCRVALFATCLSLSLPSGSEAQRQAEAPVRGAGGIDQLIGRIRARSDSIGIGKAVDTLLARAQSSGGVLTEDSTVVFLYHGPANRVSVPGDLNGWDPRADTMTRLGSTDVFYLRKKVDPASRIEYKLFVDSIWTLDPLNPREVIEGFGPNSELWMPAYRPPTDIIRRESTGRGELDTIAFTSTVLRSRHPVLVYLPVGYRMRTVPYPVLFVLDGGEYLTLGRMRTVLDNLIADGAVDPIVAVFVDPRTDPSDPRSTTRMADYALSDAFVVSLTKELRPLLLKRYRILDTSSQTGIMGASLGGLEATYAAFTCPDVFGLCAAQSPAYQWEDDTLLAMVRAAPNKGFRMYLDTGTIQDAQVRVRRMRDIMKEKRYDLVYAEHPEGHNWANWRAHVANILKTFWGRR